MRYLPYIALAVMLSGCGTVAKTGVFSALNPFNWFSDSERHENVHYAPATEGGNSFLEIDSKRGTLKVGLKQPENTKDAANMKVTIYPLESTLRDEPIDPLPYEPKELYAEDTGQIGTISLDDVGIIEIETNIGASTALEFNEVSLENFNLFTYIGAIVFIAGIIGTVLTVTVFKGVIPIWLGPLVMLIGAFTSYMTVAIPKYGPYVLFLLLVAGAGYFIHHNALRKDHPKKSTDSKG